MNFLLDPAVAIYFALAVALAVWGVFFVYLLRVDRSIKALERKLDAAPEQDPAAPRATIERRTPTI